VFVYILLYLKYHKKGALNLLGVSRMQWWASFPNGTGPPTSVVMGLVPKGDRISDHSSLSLEILRWHHRVG
jgi:hypothetical protein